MLCCQLYGTMQRVPWKATWRLTWAGTNKRMNERTFVSSMRSFSARVKDLYPTRKGTTGLYPRVDPVIWKKNGTAPTGPLTVEQLNEYEERGFIVENDVFTANELKSVIDAVNELKCDIESDMNTGEDTTLSEQCTYSTEPGTNKLRSLFGLHRNLPAVAGILENKAIISRVRQILADDVYLHHNLINFHTAFHGTGHTWHSDFEIFHAEDGMPRMRAAVVGIMLSKNTPERGAMMVLPGTHKIFVSCATETPKDHLMTSSKYKNVAGETDHTIITDMANQHGIEYLLGDVGTVFICDINILHSNHSNITPWDRINLLPIYNSLNNKLEKPFSAPWHRRPEYIAARDPENVKPIRCL